MTMKGSLPPSSRTVFLIFRPAAAATWLPAFAAGQRDGRTARVGDHLLHLTRADEQRLEDAFGETRPAEDLLDGQGALRARSRRV